MWAVKTNQSLYLNLHTWTYSFGGSVKAAESLSSGERKVEKKKENPANHKGEDKLTHSLSKSQIEQGADKAGVDGNWMKYD